MYLWLYSSFIFSNTKQTSSEKVHKYFVEIIMNFQDKDCQTPFICLFSPQKLTERPVV